MNNIELKNGDVIIVDTPNCDNATLIVNKIDDTRLYSYVEYDSVDNYLFFEKDIKGGWYDLSYVKFHRFAKDEEIEELYNALGKHFTNDYDKDWYNHFTDSSYFDVQDFLFNVFGINVEYYDNDMIYPDFINEIHKYIWDGLCDAMKMPDEVDTFEFIPVSNEMVNKREFIEKLEKWIRGNTDWLDEYNWECRNPNYGLWDELKKFMEE